MVAPDAEMQELAGWIGKDLFEVREWLSRGDF
jgi:hypothetical protein